MNKQLSKGDILKDTVWHYNEDPTRRCPGKFNGSNLNQHCAVGRYFKDEFKAMGQELPQNDCSLSGLLWPESKHHDHFLKEEASGHELEFWTDLLKWHDDDRYFDKLGLKTAGWDAAERLAQKWLIDHELKQEQNQLEVADV